MKRVLSLFLSCIFVLGVCFSTPIVASAASVNDVFGATTQYKILSVAEGDTQGTCALIKYDGTGPDVTISGSAMYDEIVSYTITQISAGAFSGNSTVETITISETVTTIDDGAFAGCSALTAFVLTGEDNSFYVSDGVLFNKAGTKLLAYPAAKEGTEYTIPETVTEIATGAFADCVNLKYIFTEKAPFGENDAITIGENNNIFSQSGVYHEGMTGHTWENGACTECGLVCEHTGVTCGGEGSCTTCGATYTASHEWTFANQDGENVITATCENVNCIYAEENAVTITLVSPTDGLVYDGSEKTANVTVSAENTGIQIPEIEYSGDRVNVTEAGYTATITLGDGENVVTATMNLNITSKSLTDNDVIITGLESSYVYTGSAIEPSVVVKDENDILVKDRDYTVEYSNNTEVSTEGNPATVTITFKGNYSGTVEKTFEIVAHKHSWSYVADAESATITATCNGEGHCGVENKTTTITLKLPENSDWVYNNEAKKFAFIDGSIDGVTLPEVVYSGNCINAGDYTASITLLGEDGKEATVTVPFTIEKATATFTVPTANTELTYSGQPQALVTAGTTTGGTMQYKLGETGDWSIEIPTGTDAGTYKVYYKVAGNENYDGVDYSENSFVEVKIAPKTITATLTQDSGVYNESAHEPAVEFGGLCENEILEKNIDYTVSYTDNTNVGTATVTVKLCDTSTAKNYTFANNAKTTTLNYTITKGVASINETPIANELTYTGTEQELVTAGSATGGTIYYTLTPTDENSWSVDVPTATKAGTYKVFYKVIGNENYDGIDYSESNFVEVKIAKKELSTISFSSINSQPYTGLQIMPSDVKVIISENGAPKVLANTEYTLTYGENVNAGTGTVTVVLSDNYEYTGNPEDLTVTFTINKATPDVEKFAFTAPENLTYDGNEKTATVVVKDGITGMGAITIKYYDANGALLTETPKAEGTYTVKIDIAEGTNFVAATEIRSGDWKFTIKAHEHDWEYTASGAVITATCQNNGCDIKTTTVELVAPENLVYDGTEKSVTVKAPHADLLSEYTVTNMKATDAGKYTAFIKIGNATASLDFEISKAVIVVTKVTAIDRVYDGNLVVSINKTDGIVYTGLIDGDKVGFDLSALTGTLSDANVGSNKTVKVNGSIVLTGEDAKNYDVSTPGVTNVNITPATVTITPDAKTSEQYYGLPALTCKVTGFIGADTLTKAPTLTTNADIKKTGDYTITAVGAEASANYVIKYATAPLTITAHKNHIVKDGTWKETVHGTCMVAGKEAGTCTLCGGTITRDSKTDPNNHTLITTVTKFQTCTQNGEALVTCANGCKYSLKTAVPADGKSHNFAKDFTVIESTCVATGSKFKVCENEGCKVVTEKTEIAINPAAHKNIVTINAKEATCEEKGYTGDEFCNDCKKTIDPGIEINAKGHTESDWIVDKEATFTEEGAKHTVCTVCNKELKKEVIAKRALETPKVKIENVSNGIKVSWSQDEDAAGYTVYSSIYNASTKKWSAWKNRGTAAANRSSWTDKTVIEGVTYRYTVRAVNGSNRSAYKATAGLLYVSAPKVTVTISSTGLLAKWKKVNNATGYIVYRRALVNGVWSSWVNLGTTAPEKNSWFDSNVQSGVSYRYTVRAVVNKVRGGYIASSAVIYLAQPLLNISNATAGVAGKWEPIAGATGYTIYRSEYNPSTKKWTKWLNLGTTKATAKSFTDKTAKSGYQYKYTIRAVNGKFRSTYQDSNKLVYLAQPTLKISNVANGIQGSWNQVNGATGYIIYRRELKDGKWSSWTSLGTTKATAKTFTDKTVKSGVTYRYTVRATNGVDRSSYASTGSLVFLSVPKVKISSGITGVNVSWSKIDGATSYLVYRREIANGKWTGWSRITTVTETSFVDETAKSGTYYRYTVRALNGKSSSKYTSTSTLYYLATPIVTVAKIDDGIKVNWTQVTGVTGYTIYRAQLGADGKWSKWVTLGTATDKYSSCKDKTAKTGVTYKYTVRAVNGKVRSAYIDGAQIVNTVQ